MGTETKGKRKIFGKKILREAGFTQPEEFITKPELPKNAIKPKTLNEWRVIEDALDKTVFFFQDPIDQLSKRNVVQDMYLKQYKSGIFARQEGHRDNLRAIYVVKSGEFEVMEKRRNVLERVNLKKVGDVFGEKGCIFDLPSSATVVATKDSEVWVLERRILRYHLKNLTENLKENQNVLFLNCIPTLQNLEASQKRQLIQQSKKEEFQPQDLVIKQGERGDKCYVILEGEAAVYVNQSDGQPHKVNQLFRTDIFGERALDNDEPREATIQALQRLVCLVFDKETYRDIRQHFPSREFRNDQDQYRYATYTRRTQGGTPSSIPADVIIYKQIGGDSFRLERIALCKGHMEEVTELVDQTSGGDDNRPAYKYMELVEGKTVGAGAFSKVSVVTERTKGKKFALKRIEQAKVVQCYDHIYCEQIITKNLQSEFCVRLYASFKDDRYLYMLFDLQEGGDLMDLLSLHSNEVSIKKNKNIIQKILNIGPKVRVWKGLDEDYAKFYIAQIVLAIEYLHNEKIVYRDLKPENVFLDREGYAKLGDFGFCKKLAVGNQLAQTFCGTPAYIAPENILQKGYSFSVDMWGLGVVIYNLLTGIQPFQEHRSESPYNIMKRIMNPNYEIHYPQYISDEAKDLMQGLLRWNVSQRLQTASDVKNHPWFAHFDFEKLKSRELPCDYRPNLNNYKRVKDLNQHPGNESCQSQEYTISSRHTNTVSSGTLIDSQNIYNMPSMGGSMNPMTNGRADEQEQEDSARKSSIRTNSFKREAIQLQKEVDEEEMKLLCKTRFSEF